MNAINDLDDLIETIYHFLHKLIRKKIPSEKILDERINILVDAESKTITIDLEVIPSSLSSIKNLNPIIGDIVEESIIFGEKKLTKYDRSNR